MLYTQHYSPLSSALVSLLLAALPVLVLFYLLVIKRTTPPIAAAGCRSTALRAEVPSFSGPFHSETPRPYRPS